MTFWPFRRRRNTALCEKRIVSDTTRAATAPQTPVTRQSSRRGSPHRRRRTSSIPAEKSPAAKELPRPPTLPASKGRGVQHHASREDITALPLSPRLQSSPHLRAVGLDRPQIPYDFRPPMGSQTSVQWHEHAPGSPRPQTLRSKRGTADYAPSRKTSKASVKSKRQEEAVREEQIRAMSAAIPIPKRPGDGPLQRESRTIGGPGMRASSISLPPQGSVHTTMSGVLEQRGWEVGGLAIFNPRPAVRLSGVPQYVTPTSLPNASGFLYRIDSISTKDPSARDVGKKQRRTVGNEANELDASDLRAILERDTKRRTRRQQEQQERLERKLRTKVSRDGVDGEKMRTTDAEELRAELTRARAEAERRARDVTAPPTATHPAFRDRTPRHVDSETADPFISEDEQALSGASRDVAADPFTDDETDPDPPPPPPSGKPAETALEPLLEDPVVGTAQVISMSSPTPPTLSPVRSPRSPTRDGEPKTALPAVRTSDLAPPAATAVSQASTPVSPTSPSERRLGGWASFFRRSGTNPRHSTVENTASTSQLSFSNTSRESMRNQPLPAHLVDPTVRRTSRTNSGTPVRTQSKFREDLPEIPVDPKAQSLDVTTMAANAAAARRAKRSQPRDIPGSVPDADAEAVAAGRSDTPVSPFVRGHGLMSASLASIGSEGSWLASGPQGNNKRQSTQSALSRSLSKRNNDFSASYEELGGGGDRDAEYMSRNSGGGLPGRKPSSSALAGASSDEESEPEDPDAPASDAAIPGLTVHESVRRKPTLVHRRPSVRSREGLLAEFETAPSEATPLSSPGDDVDDDGAGGAEEMHGVSDDDFDEEHHQAFQSARSVKTHGTRHSRQFSAGSAKLLDVPARKPSVDLSTTPLPPPGTAGSKSSP